jgi:hypothetical protein
VDAAVAAAVRRERDRLARILLDHGLARVARDVECMGDDGASLDECTACEGRGAITRYVGDSDRSIPCGACSGTGHHAPRVTA